ncbi:MAG: lipoyl(octanoyl) transferase LipB [bacterium]
MVDFKSVMEWQDLGRMPYREAWELQERLREQRIEGRIADRMLVVEHPPVITMGRKECSADVVSPESALAGEGIELVKSNRGGRATYHGPGQLVCYFICELASFGLGIKDFVRAIEELSIRTLSDYGINAARDPDHPGLWVGRDKIVAIGLNVARDVTQHGLAINVSCDLAAFRHIIACGIQGRGITSVERIKGEAPSVREVAIRLIHHSGEVFSREMREAKAI